MQTQTRTGINRAPLWLRALEVFAWGAFFTGALTLLVARYWLLPNVERYREDIVSAVSRSLGLKVTVGVIEAGWSGLRPQLRFTDVRVFDPDGQEALVLPEVENVVSWRSLTDWDLRLHSLSIQRPRLKLRRDAQGAIHVAGIRLTQEGGDGRLADWVLAQREIQIRDAGIEWLDEQRGALPLALEALDFRLYNDGDTHAVGLSARPPRELGTSLELRAELIGRSVTELAAWNGRLFAELGYTDLAGWRSWVDYPLDVKKGQGALRVWTSLEQGRVTRATADVALTGAAVRLGAELPVLEVSSVRGRLQGRQTAQGYEFGVRGLALEGKRGAAMQSTSFRVTWQRPEAGGAERGSLVAEQIELAPLAHLAEFLPIPADLRKLLADLAPKGELADARFDWTGELPAALTYSARARFSGLGMNAWGKVPGFAGLTGRIDASEAKGNLRLASSNLEIDLPAVFPDPRIALQALDGEVQWDRRTGEPLQIRIPGLSYSNEHFAGTAFGTYLYTGAGPGAINLSAQLIRADGRHTAKYLPRPEILGAATRAWLASAILGGQSNDVRLHLKGDLRDFPFVDASKGQFLVAARVKDGVLDYATGWPRIEEVSADLKFEGDRMEITGRSGKILGTEMSGVRVAIPSLLAAHTVLSVNGVAEGPTAEFLDYIRRSPVRRTIDGLSDSVRAEGRGRLQLRLDLPLEDLAKTRVAGEYRFSGNTIVVDSRLPPIERAAGRVNFTESSMTVNDVRGQLFGGPVAISGGSGPQSGVTIVAKGDATVAGIATLFDHPWRTRLVGGAPYTATVAVSAGRTQITFESPLRGVASTLPPPLSKAAVDTLPLRAEVFPGADRDRITLTVGSIVAADFHRAKQGEAMTLQRAGVLFGPGAGEAPRVPERRGVAIQGSLRSLDLDRWRPYLGASGGDGATSFDVRIGELDILGKRLNEVAVRGAAEAASWSANLNAKELAGELSYRSEGRGRLIARMKHFSIPGDAPGGNYPEPPATASAELPAVDLLAESFTFRGMRLGRVEVVAQHEGPVWRIEKFGVVNPEGSLQGRGTVRTGVAPRTALDLKVESSDIGKLLERLGYPDRVTGGKGTLEGRLEWSGEPTVVNYGSLAGQLSLHAEGGQFPHLDAGLGRLLSAVSLNFAEATARGYPFDTISGAFTLAQGVAHSDDLKVKSSAAEVSMKGDVDFGRETQNLLAKVVPSMRRGVTTIATIVNPAVAIGMAVGQAVLKDPIGQIFSVEYTVSGSWSEPKMEKIVPPPPAGGDSSSSFLPRN